MCWKRVLNHKLLLIELQLGTGRLSNSNFPLRIYSLCSLKHKYYFKVVSSFLHLFPLIVRIYFLEDGYINSFTPFFHNQLKKKEEEEELKEIECIQRAIRHLRVYMISVDQCVENIFSIWLSCFIKCHRHPVCSGST